MKIFYIERSAFLAARVQLLRRDFAARFASIAHANKLDSVSYTKYQTSRTASVRLAVKNTIFYYGTGRYSNIPFYGECYTIVAKKSVFYGGKCGQ